ncbi:ABC transporter ATP-binding protein [Crossiella cryophila]|uniref:Iron complex transport system ATP-binding protein n=1 Tax=Crossiella cryophila TaxID=43355 RepID=A0A7W7C6Q4_9PSEU|nr:ABC transporter ATP-binding protein [Crossiella cryophila]MBB4675506.1 iron complex transport system ATP-binding protein [Crossiella cryophila]
MSVRTEGVRVALGGRIVVDGVDLELGAGEVLGLVGPNGSGKTSLLRTLYRALAPAGGAVLVDERPVAGFGRRELARTLAATTQESEHAAALTVTEVVTQGRTCHRGWLESLRADDHAAVGEAIKLADLEALRDRDVRTLSGGERQRVSIARALAQQPRILVLDEPTNHLDLRHQLAVLELLRARAGEGLSVLLTLHDLRLAVEHCDRLVVLEEGRVVTAGPPVRVLTADLLAGVFGVRGQLRELADGRSTVDIAGTV